MPVFLPEEFHGQRSLAGYSPWGCKGWTQMRNCDFHIYLISQNIPSKAKKTWPISENTIYEYNNKTYISSHTIKYFEILLVKQQQKILGLKAKEM